jgi:hypothetical protein
LFQGLKRVTWDLEGAMVSFLRLAQWMIGAKISCSFLFNSSRSKSDSRIERSTAYEVRMSARAGQSKAKNLNWVVVTPNLEERRIEGSS